MNAMGGAFALQVLTTFFFMPESAFHRKGSLNIDTGDKSIFVEHMEKRSLGKDIQTTGNSSITDMQEIDQRKTWKRELLPYDGFFDHVSFWRTLLRPFCMLASPIVIWATLLFTTCISWLVLISITLSQIFSAPPYNFSVGSVGASNLSSFVASLIGTATAGPLIDGLVKFMSKKNRGTFGELCQGMAKNSANP